MKMFANKKRLILLLAVVFIMVIGLYLVLFLKKKGVSQPTSIMTPAPTLFPSPIYFEPSKSFALIYEDPEHNYKISKVSLEKEYLISILGSPFLKYQNEAESAFLFLLRISKEEACRLTVSVTTPYFANPDESGKTYPLSFCPQP